jgi:hypothetical protein
LRVKLVPSCAFVHGNRLLMKNLWVKVVRRPS